MEEIIALGTNTSGMEPAITTCKNCGHRFEGNYCNVCGEKTHLEHHKKITHLLEEAFHFITHFDGSFFQTLKTIFLAPGKLSLDYCNGIRKKYFKPISFFLLCVVLYLLFPKFEGLNMRMDTFINPKYNLSWMTVPLVKKKMSSSSISYADVAKKYDTKSPKVSKIFLFILIPMMAGVLFILFFKKRRYYFDHFILATEYGSVWITVKFLLLPLIMVTGGIISSSSISFFDDSNFIFWRAIDFLFLVFVIAEFKRFYQQNWLLTILKAIIFLAIFEVIIMHLYHSLLFLTIMLFI